MVSRKGPAIELKDEEVEKALKDIVAWAEDEFEDRDANEADNTQVYQVAVSYAAPIRPRDGMQVYADGVKWNPGAGAGMYYYSNGIWVPLNGGGIRGAISGLTLFTVGAGSASFGVNPGAATDSTGAATLLLPNAIGKTTSVWGAGSGQGGLDTGAIANSTFYHVFLIGTAAGATDVLFSLSPTTPTMPAGYIFRRLIGSMLTDISSKWVEMIQFGDEVLWKNSVTGVGTAGSVAAVFLTLAGLPTGIKVVGLLSALAVANGAGEGRFRLYSPDVADEVVATTNLNVGTFGVASEQQASDLRIRTDTSARIRMISVSATSSLTIGVHGFIHPRGKDD